MSVIEDMEKHQNFLHSLKTAFFGIISAFNEEKNFRIQSMIALVVIFFMELFGLTAVEKSILILTMLVVLSLELINSQIEKFLDVVSPDHHPRVKIIKDLSAGAVLLSALGSVVIGILLFLPHI